MITVGLTGGIGSGKSTVAKAFGDLGVPVYDSDAEAKLLMTSSKEMREEIIALFGDQAYLQDELNRNYIAARVFADKTLLERLNAIVHPAVRIHFSNWREAQTAPYVIQESALIFENGIQDAYDFVILVTAPKSLRVERVVKRDRVSEEKVHDRIENQLGDPEKIDLADFIIENVDLEDTKEKVNELHNTLSKLAQPQF